MVAPMRLTPRVVPWMSQSALILRLTKRYLVVAGNGVRTKNSILMQHCQNMSSAGAMDSLGGGWRAPDPNPAHDIAHQCPPGASLAVPPVGFDVAAAKTEEAERFAAIATMTREEAEQACDDLCVVVWKPQSGRPVPLERLQQHLRDHFALEQAEKRARVVASNAAAAAAAAAEAQGQGSHTSSR